MHFACNKDCYSVGYSVTVYGYCIVQYTAIVTYTSELYCADVLKTLLMCRGHVLSKTRKGRLQLAVHFNTCMPILPA